LVCHPIPKKNGLEWEEGRVKGPPKENKAQGEANRSLDRWGGERPRVTRVSKGRVTGDRRRHGPKILGSRKRDAEVNIYKKGEGPAPGFQAGGGEERSVPNFGGMEERRTETKRRKLLTSDRSTMGGGG